MDPDQLAIVIPGLVALATIIANIYNICKTTESKKIETDEQRRHQIRHHNEGRRKQELDFWFKLRNDLIDIRAQIGGFAPGAPMRKQLLDKAIALMLAPRDDDIRQLAKSVDVATEDAIDQAIMLIGNHIADILEQRLEEAEPTLKLT
jgi:hypothetical protein